MNLPLDIILMAAGKGTRMKSQLPKVLQPLAHQPLAQHVLDTVANLNARSIVVVVGHQADVVQAHLHAPQKPDGSHCPLTYVTQSPQLGTGHAVQTALHVMPDDGMTVVLSGDVPLTPLKTLQTLIDQSQSLSESSGSSESSLQALSLLTLRLDNPTGYGRIKRSIPHDPQSPIVSIVEEKDASPEEKSIQEVYSGILAVPTRFLRQWVERLQPNNAQKEYYLTDVVAIAQQNHHPIGSHTITEAWQVAGVNSPAQLAELEREYQKQIAHTLMAEGVRLRDPARLDVRGHLWCDQDVSIDVNCVFTGTVRLGVGVKVGANCCLSDVIVADGVEILPMTHIEGQPNQPIRIGKKARIGPFTRLRPGTVLGESVHVGNFVEIKNATLAQEAKANHLAYIGDATVGERVNYGAGSITANYDGANKHQTIIESDVHVGSNCVLVAPITLGAGGTIGGGSTVTQSTPAGGLTVARSKQAHYPKWKRPLKIRN